MSGTPERPTHIPATFHGFLAPFPQRGMTKDETWALISLMASDRAETNPAVLEELMKDFSFAVLKKRLDAYKVPCEIRVSYLCRSFAILLVSWL